MTLDQHLTRKSKVLPFAGKHTKGRLALAFSLAKMLSDCNAERAFVAKALPELMRCEGITKLVVHDCGRVETDGMWGRRVEKCPEFCMLHHLPKECPCGYVTQAHRQRIWLHRRNVNGCRDEEIRENRRLVRAHVCEVSGVVGRGLGLAGGGDGLEDVVKHWDDNKTYHVSLNICGQCLNGAGGQCHTPDCFLWIKRAPDLPTFPELVEVIASFPSYGSEDSLAPTAEAE